MALPDHYITKIKASDNVVYDIIDAVSGYQTANDVQNAIESAITGASSFQGTVNTPTDISGLTDYTAGWYWVVATADTYAGQVCEVGDMIFCINDFSSAYSADDFDVVQNNIDTISNTDIDNIISQ